MNSKKYGKFRIEHIKVLISSFENFHERCDNISLKSFTHEIIVKFYHTGVIVKFCGKKQLK